MQRCESRDHAYAHTDQLGFRFAYGFAKFSQTPRNRSAGERGERLKRLDAFCYVKKNGRMLSCTFKLLTVVDANWPLRRKTMPHNRYRDSEWRTQAKTQWNFDFKTTHWNEKNAFERMESEGERMRGWDDGRERGWDDGRMRDETPKRILGLARTLGLVELCVLPCTFFTSQIADSLREREISRAMRTYAR